MKYCKKCGKELDNGATFCPLCGTQVDEKKNQSNDSDNKKIIIILAAVLTAIAIICATVIVIFVTKSNREPVATTQITESTTTPEQNVNEKKRLNSLYRRYGDAVAKAEEKGVKVKKEKKVAKAYLERFDTAIKNNDVSKLEEYGDDAEKAVSKLESATNKTKKIKKKKKVKSYYIPPSDYTTCYLAPVGRITKDMSFTYAERTFGNHITSQNDLYGICIIARNEIYALHGCHFDNPDLQRYFEHQTWYKDEGRSSQDSSYLTKEELHNANVLLKEQKKYKNCSKYKKGNSYDFDWEDYLDIATRCCNY